MTSDEVLDSLDKLDTYLCNDGDDSYSESLDRASDAVAFLQSTWETVAQLKGKDVDSDPEPEFILQVIDRTNNQLSAAVLFLAGLDIDIPKILRGSADSFEKEAEDTEVGKTIAAAYRSLADTIDQTKHFKDLSIQYTKVLDTR